jgi:hypothetical protein
MADFSIVLPETSDFSSRIEIVRATYVGAILASAVQLIPEIQFEGLVPSDNLAWEAIARSYSDQRAFLANTTVKANFQESKRFQTLTRAELAVELGSMAATTLELERFEREKLYQAESLGPGLNHVRLPELDKIELDKQFRESMRRIPGDQSHEITALARATHETLWAFSLVPTLGERALVLAQLDPTLEVSLAAETA